MKGIGMEDIGMEGIVNVLKPPGMTSSNVVSDIRRLFGIKRVGHTGTLDPGAAGVLPVCLGRAARLFDLLVDKQKEYIAEVSFGARTDTQDSYGSVTERSDTVVTEDALRAVLPAFLGRQSQMTPAYSAVKVNGQAMHMLARRGEEIPSRVREIEIFALSYIDKVDANRHLLRIVCSRGTYVRTLLEDIGRRLGVCAHMSFLLRASSGAFRVEESYSIAELAALREEGRLHEAVVPVEEALAFLPSVRVSVEEERLLLHGRAVPHCGGQCPACRVYGTRFLGVGAIFENELKLKLHL